MSNTKMDLKDLPEEVLYEAQSHIYKHTFSYMNSMCLKCALQLRIPDIIHARNNQPITIHELASSLRILPAKVPALQRIMRLLVHNGFFAMAQTVDQEEEGYILTPSSMLLLNGDDHVKTLSPYVTLLLDPAVVSPWHSVADYLRTDHESIFETGAGMNFIDYLKAHPEIVDPYSRGMGYDSRITSLVLKEQRAVFEGIETLVDVGGGTGTLGRMICEAFPSIKYTVLDIPKVIEKMKDCENLKFFQGDMHRFVPPADAVLIKSTLQNCDDEECVGVLKRCKEAIRGKGEGGKVIIIEVLMDEKNKARDDKTEVKLLLDKVMMMASKGKVRSEAEWEKIFLEAGFSRYQITPMPDLRSIIEVFP